MDARVRQNLRKVYCKRQIVSTGFTIRVFVEFYYFRFLSVKFMINTHSHTHIHILYFRQPIIESLQEHILSLLH